MNKIIRIHPENPEVAIIREAVDLIRDGGVIVYPTDTVYGLGANALNPDAVLRIFKIKNRSLDQPLPVAVSSLEMAEKLAFFDDDVRKLLKALWPGALTVVVEKKPIVPSVVVGGGTSVGLRMPKHSIPLMIIQMSNLPLIATSANKHGKPSPIEANEVIKQIGSEIDLILDCEKVKGQPSTIIDLTKTVPLLIRSGPVARETIEKIIGFVMG